MNKKGIIISICAGATLLLGSLCTTFYVVHRMNKVEDMLVFSTETTTTNEIVETTTTTASTIITEEVVTEITTTIPEEVVIETTVTEELDVIEAVPNNNNNNNNWGMTRGQWYEENGYGGAPEQEESFDHDEFLSMKNSEGTRFAGEYFTTIDLSGSIGMGDSHSHMKNGEAIVGVDTGINVGDTIYVVEIGYFTVVELSHSTFMKYDKVVRCYSDDLFYGDDDYRRWSLTTDVYIIGD